MKYRIDASKRNPTEAHVNDVAVSKSTVLRSRAAKIAAGFIKQGYWVEVFDDDSGEQLAGPFDPDERAPSFIL
jgi:hypothetical protein